MFSGTGNPSLLLGVILQKKNGLQVFFEKKTAKVAKERKVFFHGFHEFHEFFIFVLFVFLRG